MNRNRKVTFIQFTQSKLAFQGSKNWTSFCKNTS